MAMFLNTTKLNEWIPKLINETKKELVIIVPYIKTSDKMYNHLKEANDRGVETTLVYRENKLTGNEKAKFEALDNLNLMHHPNVHCKCYYNESYLIICSMNLYEYSELNNREMGILLHRKSLGLVNYGGDDETLFKDAVLEITEILNGAELEKKSRETIEDGFEMAIIKTERQKAEEKCKILNKAFIHKRFEPTEINTMWHATCKNYFDKINVTITSRVDIDIILDESRLKTIHDKFSRSNFEYSIQGFKIYWNWYKSSISLYINSKVYTAEFKNDAEKYGVYKKGIDELIIILRNYI